MEPGREDIDTRVRAIEVCNAMMRARPEWRLKEMGPDAYFCWSMLQALELAVFGRRVANAELGATGDPALDIAMGFAASQGAWRQWKRRPAGEAPRHGDAVRLSHLDNHGHVGVFFDVERGVVAHLLESGGFAVDTMSVLRVRGFSRPRFYRWCGGEAVH